MKRQGLSLFPLRKTSVFLSLRLCVIPPSLSLLRRRSFRLSALHFCISNSNRQRNENNLWNSMRRAREREKMKVNKSQRLMTHETKMVLCTRYRGDGVCVEGWPRVAVPFVPPPLYPPKGELQGAGRSITQPFLLLTGGADHTDNTPLLFYEIRHRRREGEKR